MLEAIEKLLILQDRDKAILRVRAELANIGPERTYLQAKIASVQAGAESSRLQVRQIESDRKKIELEVQAKKQLIEKYSLQQFQTKKNEEYRALAHEIETCKQAIAKLEDAELELMEKAEIAQREASVRVKESEDLRRVVEKQIADLDGREANLKNEAAALESNRNQLAAVVESAALSRYERLLKSKGEKAIVGIDHGVCGGCHMKLPTQVIVSCKGEGDLVGCPNCGRILYYTREMDLVAAD